MAQFDLVAAWEVDGLVDLLADCGIIEGHPWFEKVSKVVTHFCGTTAGVDSVTEMAMKRIKGVPIRTILLKHLNDEFPDFPKIKFDKLRKALAEIREQQGPPKSSKRGRKSNFADDAVITWKTVNNPHREGSARWHMWEAAYGTENRGDFLSSKLAARRVEVVVEHAYDTKEPVCELSGPTSTYFNMLVSMGHIEVKN